MSHVSKVACGLMLALGVALTAALAVADDQDKAGGTPRGEAAAKKESPAAAAFERLKSLAGDWVDADGNVVLRYRVTSGGKAVLETEFLDTDHEMITVFYMDGGDLVLTHYCGLGNQPHMRAEPSNDASKIRFKFAGGSNLDPARDMHMHDAVIHFVDDNRLKTEWSLWNEGKRTDVHGFDVTRKAKKK